MAIVILGISAFYHDSAAVILIDGDIIAAAQEERFSRIKHDPAFPCQAIKYVLEESGVSYDNLTAIAFYDKPLLKFERLLETYHAFVPKGLTSFVTAIPVWIKEKLFMKKMLRKELEQFGSKKIQLLFPEHHLSHAASAFYPSPFNEAAILTIDGVGEWATTTICHGKDNAVKILKELQFPHSIGLLYSSFTYYLGFKVNSGEYKLMGLAAYGNPDSAQTIEFKKKILDKVVDVREDGSILLNMSYFNYATGLRMTNDSLWEVLFGLARRKSESDISQIHMNMALAIQQVTEDIVIALAKTAQKITNSKNLVMAGGVALNCVANSKIANAGLFNNVWIQPAAGDAGGALGAAYAVHHIFYDQPKKTSPAPDLMKGAYLGPEYNDKDVKRLINNYTADSRYYNNFDELSADISKRLADGKVIGWFQGRMEFGPRALGNRSILGDARNPEMQKIINSKIKYREGFRPFAPSVLAEDMEKYFDLKFPSPYMLFVGHLKEALRKPEPDNYSGLELYDRLYSPRSAFQSITHVDYSARIQTVSRETSPKFWQLINDFKKQTGVGILINTSFNVRGEPIVCTPGDAYRGFMQTEMDYLVIGNYLFDKKLQKPLVTKHKKTNTYALD
ncbi:carbamoyltransferase [Mucilaginibacter sp.]|uniref:carbamoyltransferase family protein n=1 Tax=Mucilaginibacter sp. TaxID=1882438 RepID=UPI00262356A1|nr:carbamoyltransferase [Mucilaginibacter sp.]